MNKTKESILNLLDILVGEGVIKPSEIARYTNKTYNLFEPEEIRTEMEEWFKSAGVELITHRSFSLDPCPFSKEEIKEIYDNNEIVICIPKDITREELGKLFHLESWALSDSLVTRVIEKEDLWFRTSRSLTPVWMNVTGVEAATKIKDEDYVHFCIERYIVFIARMRYLAGHIPDLEYWIWLTSGRYDRSGMLIAGIDRNKRFNVHGWMPQFSASFLGARYGIKGKQQRENQF